MTKMAKAMNSLFCISVSRMTRTNGTMMMRTMVMMLAFVMFTPPYCITGQG